MPVPDPRDPTVPRPPQALPEGLRDTSAANQTRTAAATAGGAPPARLARFEVRRLLGEGAFALVYLAFDPDLNREVALKVPKAESLTPEFRDTFIRENRLAAIIHHANVCPVYEVGTHDGMPYIVMRMVPDTLAGLMQKLRVPMPAKNAVAVARKLALGLAAAHAQNVIHRDLKPANVLYDDANREVLIADFGLARFADQATAASNGVPKGTPAYMAPEQARGHADKIGPPSDLYALGVILYEMLTGRVPFAGSIWEVMRDHCETAPKPPSAVRRGLDPKLDAVCLKALAKDPKDRYRSAKEFAHELAEYLRGAPSGETAVIVDDPPLDEPPAVPKPAAVKGHSVPPPLPPAPKSRSVPPPLPPAPKARPVARPVAQPVPAEPPPAREPKPRRRRAKLLWAAVAVLLLAGTVAGTVAWNRHRAAARELERELENDWAAYKTAAYSGRAPKFFDEYGPARWREWQRAADGGNPRAMVLYARCLARGTGVPSKDLDGAFRLLKGAAASEEPLALTNLGTLWESGEGTGTGKDVPRALALYRQAADLGESASMVRLGDYYRNLTAPDYDEARKWYARADAAGNAIGTTDLGEMYDFNLGGVEDKPRAHDLYLKAANQGYAFAQVRVGYSFLTRGTESDFAEARKWFELAAKGGNVDAPAFLANLWQEGKGGERSNDEARYWLEKGVEGGSAVAMNDLGIHYLGSKGVPEDQPKAKELFERAANKGSAHAQHNLGWMYERGIKFANGLNGSPDLPEALKWYKKAADNGHEQAKAAVKRLEGKK